MRRVRRRKWRRREVLGGRVNIYSPYRILQRSVTSSSIVFDQISDTASRKEATGPIPPLPLFTRWAHACSYRLPFYMHPCGSGEGLRRNDNVGRFLHSVQIRAPTQKKSTGFQYCGPSGAPPTFKFVMITLWIGRSREGPSVHLKSRSEGHSKGRLGSTFTRRSKRAPGRPAVSIESRVHWT